MYYGLWTTSWVRSYIGLLLGLLLGLLHSAAGKRRSVGRVAGGVAPAETPVATGHALALWRPLPTDGRRRRWATTWASSLGHCANMNGAPLTRTPPRRSWGRGPPPPGVAANPGPSVNVSSSSTASYAAPTGRVPGLRGAFIIASTPSLLCWFRGPTSRYCCAVECLDSVAFFTYLLTQAETERRI